MAGSYRFVRLDAARPPEEVILNCQTDDDALLIASRIGRSVEVWLGERRLGLVGEPVEAPAAPGVQVAPVAAAPAPEPSPRPETAETESHAFNPFSRAAWRRRRPAE